MILKNGVLWGNYSAGSTPAVPYADMCSLSRPAWKVFTETVSALHESMVGEAEFVGISIVIPTLNEESCIGRTIKAIMPLHGKFELIVVDGGSSDKTVDVAAGLGCVVLQAQRGRGVQLAAGAKVARGEILWFLHADSIPPAHAFEAIRATLADNRVVGGNFSLRFDSDRRSARQLSVVYPYLRLLGLCYGDSGIFVRREVYREIGGFQSFPLFEDVDLVRRLRKRGGFRTVADKLVTSSRRFENRNFAAVFAQWTALQTLYWAGVPPRTLAAMYVPIRSRSEHGL